MVENPVFEAQRPASSSPPPPPLPTRSDRDDNAAHPPSTRRVSNDSDIPSDASALSLEQLKELKNETTARKHSFFESIDFSKYAVDVIDALFPKVPKGGSLDPPLHYRSNASKIRMWRRFGNKQQQQELEPKLASQARPPKRQRRNRTSADRTSADEGNTTESTPIEPLAPPYVSALSAAAAPSAAASSIPPPQQAPVPPPREVASCQGLTIDVLIVDNRSKTKLADAEMVEQGFCKLIGEAMHNTGTAISQQQEWPLRPDLGYVGVLDNHNTACVSYVLRLRTDSDSNYASHIHHRYGFVTTSCQGHAVKGCTACACCLAVRNEFVRKCRKKMGSLINPEKENAIDGRRLDYINSPTEHRKLTEAKSRRKNARDKKYARLREQVRKTIESEPEREPDEEFCKDWEIDHVADLFECKDLKQLATKQMAKEEMTRLDICELLWEESLLQARRAKNSNKKACRYSPLMLKFALQLKCKLGNGRYDMVSRVFHLPSPRRLQTYTAHGGTSDDGIMYENLMAFADHLHERHGDIGMTHPLRHVAGKWDSFVHQDGLVYDAQSMKLVGLAYDETDAFDPIKAAFATMKDAVQDSESEGAEEERSSSDELSNKQQEEVDKSTQSIASDVTKSRHYLIFLGSNLYENDRKFTTTLARFGMSTIDSLFLKKTVTEITWACFDVGIVLVHLGFDGATENRTAVLSLATETVEDLIKDGFLPHEWTDDPMIDKDLKLAYYHPCFPKSDRVLIWLGSDMPHAIKKVVNALEWSSDNRNRRKLRFRGYPLHLMMLYDLWMESKRDGNLTVTKLTDDHFFKNASSRMRVYLAVQVTSASSVALIDAYSQQLNMEKEYSSLRLLFVHLNRFVDIMNARSYKKMSPIDSPEHPYLNELLDLSKILFEWKQEAKDDEHSFLPISTYQDLQWCIFGTIGFARNYIKVPDAAAIGNGDKTSDPVCQKPILDQGRFGSDDNEHRAADLKSRGATTKRQLDLNNSRADSFTCNAAVFNMKPTNNSAGIKLKARDLNQPLTKTVLKRKADHDSRMDVDD